MAWLTWIPLVGGFAGAAWVWYQMFGKNSDVVSCCGCGQCAATGECVMVKKSAKKCGARLTNPDETI